MEAVSDQAIGEIVPQTRMLMDVRKGYTPFVEGDILWAKITPCMQNGKTAIAINLENGIGFGSTEWHVFRPLTSDLLTSFLWNFVGLENIRFAAQSYFSGSAGQQRVPADFFERLPFPLPPIEVQHKLVAQMDSARALRKAKLAEADALLAGLDGFLLETLGLAMPAKDERKVFAVKPKDLQQHGRLNSDYFHPERILAIRNMERAKGRVNCQRLAEVVEFVREQIKTPGPNYFSLAHVQSHTGERVEANEEVDGACSNFLANDVLFARLRPYLNKVYRAEMDGCCSPEFHVLRIRYPATLLPDYLATILRSSLILAQTRHMMTGNTHPRLTNDDVVNLVIPVPEIALQERIATEARRRRDTARKLRTEAEQLWQAAKAQFEAALLGEATTL